MGISSRINLISVFHYILDRQFRGNEAREKKLVLDIICQEGECAHCLKLLGYLPHGDISVFDTFFSF